MSRENEDRRAETGGRADGTAGKQPFTVNITAHAVHVNLCTHRDQPVRNEFDRHVSMALDVLQALEEEVPGLRLPLRHVNAHLESFIFGGNDE